MFKIKERDKSYKKTVILATAVSILIIATFAILFFSNFIKKIRVNKSVEASYIEQYYQHGNYGDKHYMPIYHFAANGAEYECKSTIVVHSEEINTGIVYYDVNDPTICMTDYSYSNFTYFYIFLLPMVIGIAIFIYCIISLRKENKQVKKVNYLLQNGILIKGIPYSLTEVNFPDENIKAYIQTDYTFPDGVTRKLKSYKTISYFKIKKGSIDLLYDPKNYDNYYIGIDIERI